MICVGMQVSLVNNYGGHVRMTRVTSKAMEVPVFPTCIIFILT